MNVPIIVAGEVIGTINCLHEAGFYKPGEGFGPPRRSSARRAVPAPPATQFTERRSIMADKDLARGNGRRRHLHRPRLLRDRPSDGRVAHHHGQVRHHPAGFRERAFSTVLEKAGVEPGAIKFLAHGTTVVINALTERKGSPKVGP